MLCNSILEMSISHKYKYINIFRHLKLAIALAITASIEWKIKASNSAAQVSSGGINTIFKHMPMEIEITSEGHIKYLPVKVTSNRIVIVYLKNALKK